MEDKTIAPVQESKATGHDTKEHTPEEVSKVGVTKPISESITLSDGQVLEIKKLKANKYYQVQKHVAEWLSKLQDAVAATQKDMTQFVDEKGNPDMVKISKEVKKNPSLTKKMISMFDISSDLSGYTLDIVADALGMDRKKVGETFYAEDINDIVAAILRVNDFVKNLKNFVAPITGLGAMTM